MADLVAFRAGDEDLTDVLFPVFRQALLDDPIGLRGRAEFSASNAELDADKGVWRRLGEHGEVVLGQGAELSVEDAEQVLQCHGSVGFASGCRQSRDTDTPGDTHKDFLCHFGLSPAGVPRNPKSKETRSKCYAK